jgi:hypothetical protein
LGSEQRKVPIDLSGCDFYRARIKGSLKGVRGDGLVTGVGIRGEFDGELALALGVDQVVEDRFAIWCELVRGGGDRVLFVFFQGFKEASNGLADNGLPSPTPRFTSRPDHL